MVIAHNIHYVYEVADRFVVLGRGVKIAEFRKKDVTPEDVMEVIRTCSAEPLKIDQ